MNNSTETFFRNLVLQNKKYFTINTNTPLPQEITQYTNSTNKIQKIIIQLKNNNQTTQIQNLGNITLTKDQTSTLWQYFQYSHKSTQQLIFVQHKNTLQQTTPNTNTTELIQQYQNIINTSNNIICLKDNQSRWIIANNTTLNLFGLKNVDYKNKTDKELFQLSKINKENLIACTDKDEIAWNSKQKYQTQLNIELPNGDHALYDLTKTPFFFKDGNKKAILTFGTNITERTTQNKKLQELVQEKERILMILSHDLKNPFAQLVGLTQLIQQNHKKYDDHKLKEMLNNISEISQRGNKLIQNMSYLSRLERNKLISNYKTTNLEELTQELENEFQLDLEKKQLKLIIANEHVQNIITEPNFLATILRNLISNAIKFSNPLDSILIHIRNNNNTIQFEVTDFGVGMTEKQLENLFSTQNTTTPGTNNEPGTGIGLVIVNELAKKLNARILIHSERNSGTTFKIIHPIQKLHAQ